MTGHIRMRFARRIATTAAVVSASISATAGLAIAGTGSTAGTAVTSRYVALGDSYASGSGLSGQQDSQCARSNRSYPALLALVYKSSFKNATCTGATTRSIWNHQGSKPPQANSLSADTTLVTLTIGGNDIGFSEIIATCISGATNNRNGNPCEKYYGDQLRQRIEKLSPRIGAVLQDIKRRSPRARVLLVGYPSLLPANGADCKWESVPFAKGDIPYLDRTVFQLNEMLRQQAAWNSTTYVDLYTATKGADMCQPANKRFIEPVMPLGAKSAHPNLTGHVMMTAFIKRTIG
ncbi:SGNH/GDSL hydrolase family protein [Nonomuraea basaltis]|uniref:SGNH/GDSL hydrolase family protein n=1 Tax=Nonomuraea basaltis TaxID=2495887 RepID=UPI001487294E|nr:SGNH/GDSL hydrolase family protein [Nonomuraea basaltis]